MQTEWIQYCNMECGRTYRSKVGWTHGGHAELPLEFRWQGCLDTELISRGMTSKRFREENFQIQPFAADLHQNRTHLGKVQLESGIVVRSPKVWAEPRISLAHAVNSAEIWSRPRSDAPFLAEQLFHALLLSLCDQTHVEFGGLLECAAFSA